MSNELRMLRDEIARVRLRAESTRTMLIVFGLPLLGVVIIHLVLGGH